MGDRADQQGWQIVCGRFGEGAGFSGELFFPEFPGGDPSFDGFYFFQSSSVSFLGCVTSAEEGFDDFEGQFGADDTGADAKDVHIVVFDPLSGGVGVVAEAGSNSWEFIGSDAYPDP